MYLSLDRLGKYLFKELSEFNLARTKILERIALLCL